MTSIIVLRKACTFGLPALHSWKGLPAHTTGCLPASMLSSPYPSLRRLETRTTFIAPLTGKGNKRDINSLLGLLGKLCSSDERGRLCWYHPSPLLSEVPRNMNLAPWEPLRDWGKRSRECLRCWPRHPCAPVMGLQGERNLPKNPAATLESSLGRGSLLFWAGRAGKEDSCKFFPGMTASKKYHTSREPMLK